MAFVLTCPDCGQKRQSDRDESQTCPACDGLMAPAPKQRYQAKTTTLEEEARGRKSSQTRDHEDEDDRPRKKVRRRDEDDDGDAPRAKKKRRSRDEDDGAGGRSDRDGRAAKALGLDPGFRDRELMRQVAGELSRREVLHFACRPCRGIAKMQAVMTAGFGSLFAVIGAIVLAFMAAGGKVPAFAFLVPVVFILVGLGMAVLGPIMKLRQARLGWYAVTDRRAVVFHVGLFSSAGRAETYEPYQLRKMWVKRSFWVSGAGDLVFKTIVTHTTHTHRDARGRSSTSTSTSKQHFGFLGVEDVRDVETLVHEVLLARRDDD